MSMNFYDFAQSAAKAAELAKRAAGVAEEAWEVALCHFDSPTQAVPAAADGAASAMIEVAEAARMASHKALEQFYKEIKGEKELKDQPPDPSI